MGTLTASARGRGSRRAAPRTWAPTRLLYAPSSFPSKGPFKGASVEDASPGPKPARVYTNDVPQETAALG